MVNSSPILLNNQQVWRSNCDFQGTRITLQLQANQTSIQGVQETRPKVSPPYI
jgi:hypothetical protein